MTRSNRIKELLAAGDFVALDLYMKANVFQDSGWAQTSGTTTIKDYKRVVSFHQEPDPFELDRILHSITANTGRMWEQVAPRVYRFLATLDTSD